ncbi:MAG: hypothetical protein LBH96_01295, partial [Candidatus Peribacteria bacterium]|nr:hypothetical protein [Candidatus Peribacteria bacterium]
KQKLDSLTKEKALMKVRLREREEVAKDVSMENLLEETLPILKDPYKLWSTSSYETKRLLISVVINSPLSF